MDGEDNTDAESWRRAPRARGREPGLHARPSLWPGCPSNCPYPERPPASGGLLGTGEGPRAHGRRQDPAECLPFPGRSHGLQTRMSVPSLEVLEDAAHLRSTNKLAPQPKPGAWAPRGFACLRDTGGGFLGSCACYCLVCTVTGCVFFLTQFLLETHGYLDLLGLRAAFGEGRLQELYSLPIIPNTECVSACSVCWTEETDGQQGRRCARTFQPTTLGAHSPNHSSREGGK